MQRGLEAPRAQRVHPRAERGEDRRQQRQRDERRHQRADQPADTHRVEEAQREHEQRRERRRDRDRREQDGAARRRHRRPQRGGGLEPALELLAEARDHEQRVVDREAEPEARDQVERVDRHRLDRAVDDPHREERDQDRRGADREREQRRDEAAEDEERERQEDREGEQLGARDVLGDLLADLLLGELAAAQRHARHAREPLLHAPEGAVDVVAEGPHHVGGAAVLRHEIAVAAALVTRHARHPRVLERLRDASELALRLRGVRGRAEPHERDHVRRGARAGGALDVARSRAPPPPAGRRSRSPSRAARTPGRRRSPRRARPRARPRGSGGAGGGSRGRAGRASSSRGGRLRRPRAS